MQYKAIVYLPGLNGLRAIAALSVVISHISLKGLADFNLLGVHHFPLAGFGVTLFFVISGFLITFLMLKEINTKGSVCIKKFYVRRILRIWPIYYLYLTVSVFVFLLMSKDRDILTSSIWFYLFFTANIPFVLQKGILIITHYWSIGVEEQFYLFWPWVVRNTKGRVMKAAILLFFILFVIKVACWFFLGKDSFAYRFISTTRIHCMMLGAIGAILYTGQSINLKKFFNRQFVQLVCWLIFFTLGSGIVYFPAIISHEIIAFVSLGLIIGQVSDSKKIINLENSVFDFIGKISYGLYVIHPMVIMLISILFKRIILYLPLEYILVYSTVLGSSILLAWLSYRFLEMPFLKLKSKFAVIQSANSMNK